MYRLVVIVVILLLLLLFLLYFLLLLGCYFWWCCCCYFFVAAAAFTVFAMVLLKIMLLLYVAHIDYFRDETGSSRLAILISRDDDTTKLHKIIFFRKKSHFLDILTNVIYFWKYENFFDPSRLEILWSRLQSWLISSRARNSLGSSRLVSPIAIS